MKASINFLVLTLAVSSLWGSDGYAQGAGSSSGRVRDGIQKMDMGHMQDHDSMMETKREMSCTEGHEMEMDCAHAAMRDGERMTMLQQKKDLIYGAELMTEQDKLQYQNHLRELADEKQRVEFRLQHQTKMQQRAKERGVSLALAPTREQLQMQERARQMERQQIYGYSLMTQSELEQYREQIRSATSEQERDKIRAAHRVSMQQRAKERGVTLPVD